MPKFRTSGTIRAVIIISNKCNFNNISLYCDEGFVIFLKLLVDNNQRNITNQCKIFSKKDLQLFIKFNLKILDYLDITLNLNDSAYHPFQKPIYEKNTLISNLTTLIHLPGIYQGNPIPKLKPFTLTVSSRRNIWKCKEHSEQCLKQYWGDVKLNYTEKNNNKTNLKP